MITKIGEKDRYGYDNIARPVAAQMIPGFVAFGYVFCARLKSATEAGFQDGCILFPDGYVILFLFSPSAKAAELWMGTWRTDDETGSYTVNPQYIGVPNKTLNSFEEAHRFFEFERPTDVRPEYLQIPTGTIPHADIVADREFALSLANTPARFAERRINRAVLPKEEHEAADDIDFLLHNLHGYVFRFHAASKLMLYANTLHFSRPQFIPSSKDVFFITMEWRQIAARDAAFSLYHFQQSFEMLRKQSIRHAPTIKAAIDLDALRIAWKLFHAQFKNVASMRNALGHEGEFYSTTKSRAKHSTQKNVFLEFVVAGETFSVESFGRRITMDLSLNASQKLDRVKTRIVGALDRALVQPKAQKVAAQQPPQN